MLAIEVDGGQQGERLAEDRARTEYLVRSGFRVLSFWNHEVLRDIETVTSVIWRALNDTASPPSLAFPLKGKALF